MKIDTNFDTTKRTPLLKFSDKGKKKNYCKNGKVRFNLKPNGQDKEKPSQIFMTFNFDGKRLRYYTGERIYDKYWNVSKQRAKSQYNDSSNLNDTLDSISNS